MGKPLGTLAERCLNIYRDNYHPDNALKSVGRDVKTVGSARELARRFLASNPPLVDDFVKVKRKEHQSVAEGYSLCARESGLNSETFSMWLNAALGADGREEPFHEGLRLVAADFIERDIPLPPPLRSYIVDVLRQPIPPSHYITRRRGRTLRDGLIRDALASVTFYYPRLKPTRNRVQRTNGTVHSVCSIVSEVLGELKINLSEDAVEKLWAANRQGFAEMNEARRELILLQLSGFLEQAGGEAETTAAPPGGK